jgi:hypothetical protein
MAAWSLPSCQIVRMAATPAPEAEQVVREEMKHLYVAASAAGPHSSERQHLIQRTAEQASNGKELLLVMQAGLGPYPSEPGVQENPADSQVRAAVTAKTIELATLDQLIVYAKQYAVHPASARLLIQRMFQLANGSPEPGSWARVREAGILLGENDLEQQAEARASQRIRR